jgi:hypothetical protein
MELRASRGVRIDYLSCLLEVAVFRKPDAASVQLWATGQLFVLSYAYLRARIPDAKWAMSAEQLFILSHRNVRDIIVDEATV